jgi:hypothetical protein
VNQKPIFFRAIKHKAWAMVSKNTAASSRARTSEYDATIRGAPAFAELDLVLRPGQMVMSNGGSLAYMREGIERGKLKVGGITGMFKRALGGQSVFLVSYKGLDVDDPESRRVTRAGRCVVPRNESRCQHHRFTRELYTRGHLKVGHPSREPSCEPGLCKDLSRSR